MKKITERKSKTPGQIISQLADNLGYSRSSLAHTTGMSYDNIAKIMKDQVNLTVEAALLLSVALEKSAEELMRIALKHKITNTIPILLGFLKEAEKKHYGHRRLKQVIGNKESDTYEFKYLDKDEIESLKQIYSAPKEIVDDPEVRRFHSLSEGFIRLRDIASNFKMWQHQVMITSDTYETPKHLDAEDIGEIADYITKKIGDSNWINLVVDRLFQKGIIFLAHKRPPHTHYHSALFLRDRNFIIAFANLREREDLFLYTLLHQLGHIDRILYGIDNYHLMQPFRVCGFPWKPQTSDRKILEHFNRRQAEENAADEFIRELLPISEIEKAAKRIGGDVDQVINALPHIPEIIVVGYFRWFKSHYRQRNLGNMRRFCDVYDPSIADKYKSSPERTG